MVQAASMAMTQSVTDVLVPRLLSVPDYQRGYSWERTQVKDFLDDLRLLGDGHRHYTGTIVLLNGTQPVVDDNFQALMPADVVDGQQRLTTVGLLLNEIRRALAQQGQVQAADGLKRQFLLSSKDGAPLLKMSVQSDARPVWLSLLQDAPVAAPETLSGKRLLNAALQIRQEVADTAQTGGVNALLAFSRKLMTSLQFTLYELDGQAEVGVVFETLNDRGKPLTELEKVKNYLLFLAARLPEGQRQSLAQSINDAWSGIYRRLLEVAAVSSAGEDQFLRAHWLAAVDPVTKRWRGTTSVKERFNRERYQGEDALLVSEVGAYAASLHRAATAFADSLRPDVTAFASFGTVAAEARGVHAQLLRAGTVAVFQPVIIALRHALPEDGRAYVENMDLCLRFAVRTYLIGGYRADAGQTRLYRLAHEVFHGKRDAAGLSEGLRRLVAEYASDDYVRAQMLDMESNWYRWGGLRYFLYEYELGLLKGGRPDTDYAYFEATKREKTVEHILPQTATSEYWSDRFDKRNRDRLTHVLGNLVLTRDNSSYSNKDFPDKRGAAGPGEQVRACYAQASLRQEQELAVLSDWTPETVLQRQEGLAAWALARWAVGQPTHAPALEAGLIDAGLDAESDAESDELADSLDLLVDPDAEGRAGGDEADLEHDDEGKSN